jgi:phosphoglycolate phosphatase
MVTRTLVLWDVDHTLIETRGVGSDLFREAFEQATGRHLEYPADVTGRTEPAIFRETVEAHHIPCTAELLDRYASLLATGYQVRQAELAARGRALPGAAEAIAALVKAHGVVQSVLTGNLRSVAETKLKTFAISSGLDLDVGAFGSDGEARPQLVAVAQRRASNKYNACFDTRNTVLIGDTPSDIEAAHDGGARIIGVATGKSSAAELQKASADIVLEDLQNTALLVSAVKDAIRRP